MDYCCNLHYADDVNDNALLNKEATFVQLLIELNDNRVEYYEYHAYTNEFH